MINTIDYNTSNSLVDFNAPYNGNNSMMPTSIDQSFTSKQNYIYHHHHQQAQVQPQHHHQMIYQQQQSANQFDSYNGSNQYPSFYNQQATNISINPTHNGYLNPEPQMIPTNVNNAIINNPANTNYTQFNYTKIQESPKKITYKGAIRSSASLNMSGYDCINLSNTLAKKEPNIVEDEDYDDEDEDDEDFDEDDEDFEDDESNDKSVYSKNSKTKKRNSKKEIDTDNDYEIKHNCLTEDGAYMNTLFNSPSSISSSSNVDMRSKTIHLMNGASHMNDGTHVLKAETADELHDARKMNSADYASQPSFSSASSSSSLSNFNEPIKMNNPHMNNMINSYAKAGIMNDHDLVNLPLRELNKRLRALPKQTAYNLKKRRRTLKNRKYAQNCRSKRLEQKSEMEIENSRLNIEINQMRKVIDKIRSENQALKNLINKNNNNSVSQQHQQHTINQPDNNQITYIEMFK